jgi:hypothetical protein
MLLLAGPSSTILDIVHHLTHLSFSRHHRTLIFRRTSERFGFRADLSADVSLLVRIQVLWHLHAFFLKMFGEEFR